MESKKKATGADDDISNFEALKFSDLIKQQSIIQKSDLDDDQKSMKSDLTAISAFGTSPFLH
jgi:hypothetical protein